MGGYAPKSARQTHANSAPVVVGDGCDLHFRVDLVGLRTDVLKDVRPGDTLLVHISESGQWRSLTCVARGNHVVGTLAAFQGLAQLISCVEEGADYIAHVDFVSSSRCSVEVVRA
jgi:hypothetical protein